MKYFVFVILALTFIAGCEKNTVEIQGKERSWIFDVEIADETHEWETGLMQRSVLRHNEGMLFVFPQEEIRYFWMKNTTIPLHILFFKKNGELAHGVNAQPCTANACPLYSSLEPVQYVLEINQGILPSEAELLLARN